MASFPDAPWPPHVVGKEQGTPGPGCSRDHPRRGQADVQPRPASCVAVQASSDGLGPLVYKMGLQPRVLPWPLLAQTPTIASMVGARRQCLLLSWGIWDAKLALAYFTDSDFFFN